MPEEAAKAENVNLEDLIVKNTVEQEGVQKAEQEIVQKTEHKTEQEAAQPVQFQREQPDMVSSGTKNYLPAIGILLVLIVAAAAALIFAVGKLFGGMGTRNEKMVAYIADGEIFYAPNMDKEKDPVSVCEVRGEDAECAGYIEFTTDGKYLYFVSRMEEGEYTLCRAEVGKLKADSPKNDKYIVEIDKKIVDHKVLEDGLGVVYLTNSGNLYYFDGESEERIVKDVASYYICDDDQTIIYTDYDVNLSYYDLETEDDDTIDNGVSSVYAYENKDFIVYTRYEEESDSLDLYCASVNGDFEKVAEGIEAYVACDADSQTVYYTVRREEVQELYAYIDDTYADADAQMTEPLMEDCLTQVTGDVVVRAYNQEYSEEYLNADDIFYERDLYYDYYLEMYYFHNYDQDESYYYEELTKQWYLYDSAKYEEMFQAYLEVEDRNDLREDLKEESVEQYVCEMYSCVLGEDPVCINTNVTSEITASEDGSVLIYTAGSEVTEKISIDHIYSVREAQELVSQMLSETGTGEWVCYTGGSEQDIDAEDAVSSIDVSEDGRRIVVRSYDYNEGRNTLTAYTLKDGTLDSGEKLTDNGAQGYWIADSYYFFAGDSTDSYDLNVYINGETERILKNISTYRVEVYENGSYPERVVYLKNDDLYVYTGKEDDRRVARDVMTFDCLGSPCYRLIKEHFC